MMERIIGTYQGKQQTGPMLIAIGAMHGNEAAGVRAIQTLLQMLENEPIKNPTFEFEGTFLGLIGNVAAFEKGQRFIEKDLNRQWAKENVAQLMASKEHELQGEDRELVELWQTILSEIKKKKPSKILVLDLHTTSAEGGIFSIVTDDEVSIETAKLLHAPVVTGLLDGIAGTTLHFFNSENLNIPTASVCFEAGQHQDPLSVNRSIAALVNALKAVGCVNAKDIENQHDMILQQYSVGLPKVAQLLYTHHIQAEDAFEMRLGYRNFQSLSEGEVIAKDIKGEIRVPYPCQILMPLYQKQGNDGFFLIEPVLN